MLTPASLALLAIALTLAIPCFSVPRRRFAPLFFLDSSALLVASRQFSLHLALPALLGPLLLPIFPGLSRVLTLDRLHVLLYQDETNTVFYQDETQSQSQYQIGVHPISEPAIMM